MKTDRVSYKNLTKFSCIIKGEKFFEWAKNPRGFADSDERNYAMAVKELEREVYRFVDSTPEFRLTAYEEILEQNGIAWSAASMRAVDVTDLDGQCIMALLVGVIRAERFSDGGVLLPFLKEGIIQRWLDRLEMLDCD